MMRKLLSSQCQLQRTLITKFRYFSASIQNEFKYGVIANGSRYEWTNNSYAHYLNSNDVGPYTVCRTVDRCNIFKYDMHINRLIHTLNEKFKQHQKIHNYQNSNVWESFTESIITHTIYNGLSSFYKHNDYKEGEARIMIYINENKLFSALCQNNQNKDILQECMITHFCHLPNVQKPVRAIIRSSSSAQEHLFNDPLKKDSQWFNDRRAWNNDKMDKELGINEVLMLNNSNGRILEGLSSSFGIFKDDGNLYIPSLDMGVLDGTVRSFIIEILEKYEPINVIFEAPRFDEIDSWKAAVIMSTSRMCLFIDELYFDVDGDERECIVFEKDDKFRDFELFTNNQILNHSQSIQS